jgi:hypothetical protein
MKRTHLLNRLCMAAVLSTGALFAAGCGDDDRGENTPPTAAGAGAGSAATASDANVAGPEVSITGCLTANLDGGSYALTPSDTANTASERTMQMPGRETLTYELVGNAEDFRRHANTVVTVRGREDASARRESDVERKDESEQRPAPGADDTPTVETKEEVEVNVRRLHASSIVASGDTCPSVGQQRGSSTDAPEGAAGSKAGGATSRPGGTQR